MLWQNERVLDFLLCVIDFWRDPKGCTVLLALIAFIYGVVYLFVYFSD